MFRYQFLIPITTIFACLAFGEVLASPNNSQLLIVRVRAESVAQKEQIELGDVSEIEARDKALAERLSAVSLGYAPDVGAVRMINRQKISLAVAAAGFAKESVSIEGSETAVVRRESQLVSQLLVRQTVEHAITAKLQEKGITARLSRLDLPARIEVPSGQLEVHATFGGSTNLFNPFVLSLEFWIEGRIVKRLSVMAQAEGFAPVLVASHDLAEKVRLREYDYKTEVKRLDHDPARYITDHTRLRGVSPVRSLAAGEAITTDLLTPEIVVKAGDAVGIVGGSGELRILITGEARAAGRVGDRIQVRNLQSGMLFQGIVIDEGLVSVRF
jgi:flagellar basal body P-ring formation protein FlgA